MVTMMITMGANKDAPDAPVRFTASFENIIKQKKNAFLLKGIYKTITLSVDVP